ncbi:MAG: Rieske (2Fe-2S) protein [Candidatus Thermoplasmatota archaeon]|nr:Rieske (2Fe-2S) protein [Candidatus Thermoplasmatota archaeon]
MTWYKVTEEGSLKNEDIFKAKIGNEELILMKIGGKFFATSHLCTHENYDLSEGFIDGETLICPNHFATFNPVDGSVISPPEGAGDISPLKSYPVKVENGSVMVEL